MSDRFNSQCLETVDTRVATRDHNTVQCSFLIPESIEICKLCKSW